MKKSTENIAIELIHVSKKYEIHHEKPTLVEKFVKGENETFWALNEINLTIKKGRKVGFMGPNGSGKTTLLKIIAGITTPTRGLVRTHGRIVSLIDLGAGFHPDLTGIQNIFLNGAVLGIQKKEIEKKMHSIIEYADIKQFIDTPMFTYSEGMKLRLGFSIAVHADPDILILDEGLGVGDELFRKKSIHQIQRFFRMKKSIIIASRWLEFVKKNCQEIVHLNNGQITSVET